MNNKNSVSNLTNDLKKYVKEDKEVQNATIKLGDNIVLCASVFSFNEKVKESSDLSM